MSKASLCLTENLKRAKLKLGTMVDVVGHKVQEWTHGKQAQDARIAIYDKIRDIPYAVLPDLDDSRQYIRILELKRGSCTPKHLLLCNMYRRIGLEVLYAVYPFRWADFAGIYPPELQELAEAMPVSYHLVCKVDINGNLVLVDATLDAALEESGLPINKSWDGLSDTLLAVSPFGDEQLYHPFEAHLMQPQEVDEKSWAFYRALNGWLETIRR